MIQSENPKTRQKQIAKLLEGTSVAPDHGVLRPSIDSKTGVERRDTVSDEGEEDRDRDKEREQDAEEKVLQRDGGGGNPEGVGSKAIGTEVSPINKKKQTKKEETDLKFSKEPINPVKPPSPPTSPLTNALQRRLPKRGDGIAVIGGNESGVTLCVTVFLPISTSNSQPGRFVQFEVSEQAMAKSLINAALKAYSRENSAFEGADPNAYRIYLAETDGEVDTDIPALQEDCTIASTGAKHFALRKKGRSGSDASPVAGSPLSRADSDVQESPIIKSKSTEKRGSEKRKSEKSRISEKRKSRNSEKGNSKRMSQNDPQNLDDEEAIEAQSCCIIA